MSDETQRLDGQITGALYEHFFDAMHGWTFGGERYEIADDVQYAALGEDPRADDLPLILVRQSDGAYFEVDLWASVSRTTPEQRDEHRRQLMAMRERALRNAAKRGPS